MYFPGPWAARATHSHVCPKDELLLKVPEVSESPQESLQRLQP